MRTIVSFFVGAALLASLSLPASAQEGTNAKSSEILRKARHIDLLNHMLPLLLTKKQLNALLPAVEKVRANVKKIEALEAADLVKLEPQINEILKDGFEKGVSPTKEQLRSVAKLFQAFDIRRQMAVSENVELVLPILKQQLNSTQIQVAAHTLDPKAFDPTIDTAKMSEDDRLKWFIRDIMLDPNAYDVMVKLLKIAPAG